MATTEIRNGSGAVIEREAQELSGKVAQQVFEILEESEQKEQAPRPAMVYRVPAAGVRYYF